jgi:hypothetical protein
MAHKQGQQRMMQKYSKKVPAALEMALDAAGGIILGKMSLN